METPQNQEVAKKRSRGGLRRTGALVVECVARWFSDSPRMFSYGDVSSSVEAIGEHAPLSQQDIAFNAVSSSSVDAIEIVDVVASGQEGCSKSAQPSLRRQQEIVYKAAEATIQIVDVEDRICQEDTSNSAEHARPSQQEISFNAVSSSSGDATMEPVDVAAYKAVEATIEMDKPNGCFDEGALMRPLTGEELYRTYGIGLKIMQDMGYKIGKGIRNVGIAQPLAIDTRKVALIMEHVRPCITESTKKRHKCSTNVVDPPECFNCKKCIWPAKMYIKPRIWICSECDNWVNPCVICRRVTWDGYNLSVEDGGQWMCSGCWSSSIGFQQCCWAWFQDRRNKFPQITLARPGSEKPDSKILDFKWDLSRLPERSAPKKLKEYPLTQKTISKLEWEGHIPDEDKQAVEVDRNFLKHFLASRPMPGTTKMADSTLQPPTDHSVADVTFYRFERAWLPEEIILIRRLLDNGWRTAFHFTKWHNIYSILCNGLKEVEIPGRKGLTGVFSHATLERAFPYMAHTLMPDGVAWSVCCELLIDPSYTATRRDNQLNCTLEDNVILIAFWTSGITFANLKELAKCQPVSTILGQWDPASETHPKTFDTRCSLHP